MGELQHEAFQFTFNGFLKVAFQGSRITSDAGLILVRELDERLGLATLIAEHLSDSRQGSNTQFSLADLLRQSVYSGLAGYEDLNDAVRVSGARQEGHHRCERRDPDARRHYSRSRARSDTAAAERPSHCAPHVAQGRAGPRTGVPALRQRAVGPLPGSIRVSQRYFEAFRGFSWMI